MKLLGVLPFARQLLERAVSANDICIDATAGNGHDTLFLAKLVRERGHVFSFDIQKQAIQNTKQRLTEHDTLNQVTLIEDGHQNAKDHIPVSMHGKVAAAIFNLGYLPGGDKSIVTNPKSTLTAINEIFSILKKEGMIVLVIYHGHEEGKTEKEAILNFVENIDQTEAHVMKYEFINQKNSPPFIIAIEKR